MTTLLIAEHDNETLSDQTHKAMTAATEMGADVHVLVPVMDVQRSPMRLQSLIALPKYFCAKRII